jgi:hypothetical protein
MIRESAIDIIEPCRSYYLLSNDKQSGPVFVGNRIKLEFTLEGISKDMVIITTGNDKRCLILLDYSTEDVKIMVQRADKKILKIKSN